MKFDLRALLLKARNVIAAIAPVTPMKMDDELPALIDAFLSDAELMGWLEVQHVGHVPGRVSLPLKPPVAVQAALERRKINLAKLPELLSAIFAIVNALSHAV